MGKNWRSYIWVVSQFEITFFQATGRPKPPRNFLTQPSARLAHCLDACGRSGFHLSFLGFQRNAQQYRADTSQTNA